MIIFLDTDVLIDLVQDRKPFSDDAAYLIEYIQKNKIKSFVAWHTISNFYYLSRTEHNKQEIIQFITSLLQFIKISRTSNEELLLATKLKISDFEDAMQIVAALAARADIIITRNTKDYKNSPIPAMNPGDFLTKYE
ncbi:PIN domain-containing protein [Candidatus Peregrinibacteria bacterium]|nr:PIN domain-containing protein [Candidatus Peregrinibacteria bacterium]